MAYHWARMIELLHSMEKIQTLLHDKDLQGSGLGGQGQRRRGGRGIDEARAERSSTTTGSTRTTRWSWPI